MPGNREGGLRAAATNKAKYGDDFYQRLGRVGGSAKVPKGFAKNLKLASKAGTIGGSISRRGKAVPKTSV